MNDSIGEISDIREIAERICGLQNIMDKTDEEMAAVTGVEIETYKELMKGTCDFTFTFLYKIAKYLGVDVVDILTGDTPKLTAFTIVKSGRGLPVKRRSGFEYGSLAYLFKNRKFDPLVVFAPYDKESADKPLELSTHKGQEFDMILSGRLKIQIDNHIEILEEGDAVFYDSTHPHGMTAANEEGCKFLAVLSE